MTSSALIRIASDAWECRGPLTKPSALSASQAPWGWHLQEYSWKELCARVRGPERGEGVSGQRIGKPVAARNPFSRLLPLKNLQPKYFISDIYYFREYLFILNIYLPTTRTTSEAWVPGFAYSDVSAVSLPSSVGMVPISLSLSRSLHTCEGPRKRGKA